MGSILPVLFDPSNIAHYPTVMHIDTSYDPEIPFSSPIEDKPIQSGQSTGLARSEKVLYHKEAISLTTSVSTGDALLAVASNIRTQDQLRVVIRYMMRYCQASAIGEVIIEETLKTMKEESTDDINLMGGADGIVERALEHHFGQPEDECDGAKVGREEPVINPEEDYDKLNHHLARIKNIDLLLDGVKELYQDLFITE